jgi:hypothetical protein
MPVPVSVTTSSVFAGRHLLVLLSVILVRTALRVSSVSVPVLRIASRAFTARLTSARSSSPRSANAFQRSGASDSHRLLAFARKQPPHLVRPVDHQLAQKIRSGA